MENKKLNIEVSIDFYAIRIRFNGMIHAYIKISELLGITSWNDGINNYSVEFSMKGGKILCQYDSEDKFREVLSGLDKVLK